MKAGVLCLYKRVFPKGIHHVLLASKKPTVILSRQHISVTRKVMFGTFWGFHCFFLGFCILTDNYLENLALQAEADKKIVSMKYFNTVLNTTKIVFFVSTYCLSRMQVAEVQCKHFTDAHLQGTALSQWSQLCETWPATFTRIKSVFEAASYILCISESI